MFGWKRQRQDPDDKAAAKCFPPPAETPQQAIANTTTSTVVACSDLGVSTPSSSIEMASTGRQGGSVRSKAAYFEALSRGDPTSCKPCASQQPQHGAFPDAGMVQADSDEEVAGQWSDFSEVHLLMRSPAARGPPLPSNSSSSGSSKYGSVADMESIIERLQTALHVKEGQCKAAVDAFKRRSAECENLQNVVRELSESRAKAACQRAGLAEKYQDLQREYHRMLRIADLSRTVSKENMAATARGRSQLRQVQSELHATKSHALSLMEKHKKVRVENALLKEKVGLLERCDFAESQESECKAFVIKAVSHAMARDGSSGGCIRTVVISKDGVKRTFIPGDEVLVAAGELPSGRAVRA